MNQIRQRWLLSLLLGVALWVANAGCDALFPLEDQSTPGEAVSDSPETPEARPAQVGVGAKGDYGPGLITTPASAYWKTREKIAFEIHIPKALQLYKALGDGSGPKSHEAFMSEIIAANRIQLPELPEGQVYRYDPDTEQVMVVPKS